MTIDRVLDARHASLLARLRKDKTSAPPVLDSTALAHVARDLGAFIPDYLLAILAADLEQAVPSLTLSLGAISELTARFRAMPLPKHPDARAWLRATSRDDWIAVGCYRDELLVVPRGGGGEYEYLHLVSLDDARLVTWSGFLERLLHDTGKSESSVETSGPEYRAALVSKRDASLVSATVQHAKFGRAVVERVTGTGAQAILNLRFEDGTQRTIAARFVEVIRDASIEEQIAAQHQSREELGAKIDARDRHERRQRAARTRARKQALVALHVRIKQTLRGLRKDGRFSRDVLTDVSKTATDILRDLCELSHVAWKSVVNGKTPSADERSSAELLGVVLQDLEDEEWGHDDGDAERRLRILANRRLGANEPLMTDLATLADGDLSDEADLAAFFVD